VPYRVCRPRLTRDIFFAGVAPGTPPAACRRFLIDSTRVRLAKLQYFSEGALNNSYTGWAIILAASLELGIVLLSYLGLIGNATTLSAGFAVGAVLVAALMLRDEEVERDEPATKIGADR
jgi:hypothetical protein